jgi:hypothetical protein
MPRDAAAVIAALELQPHPEGGWYRETYRAALEVALGPDRRAASTAIYYLLEHGDRSRLHRIRSDELWHHHAGAGLVIHCFGPAGYTALRLGADLEAGERPQHWVRAGEWFGATVEVPGAWALVGCTVAPGFEFRDLEFADRAELTAAHPAHADLVARLTAPR